MQQYNRQAVKVKNLQIERDLQQKELDYCIAPPIAAPSDEKRGSGGGASAVEWMADNREKIQQKIIRLDLDIAAVLGEREKVSNALAVLSEGERQVVTEVYIKGKSLVSVAFSLYLTERAVRKRAGAALDKLAEML